MSPTVEALPGAAAVIIALCAISGSVVGGTTISRILSRPTPSTSRVLAGWWLNPSSRTVCPAVARRAGAFAHAARSYITRSTEPSRTDSTANRSGSSLGRSLLRGHHAPSTWPVILALGLMRSRGVCTGAARWPAEIARPLSACHSGNPVSAANRPIQLNRRRRDLSWVARDIPPNRCTSRAEREQDPLEGVVYQRSGCKPHRTGLMEPMR